MNYHKILEEFKQHQESMLPDSIIDYRDAGGNSIFHLIIASDNKDDIKNVLLSYQLKHQLIEKNLLGETVLDIALKHNSNNVNAIVDRMYVEGYLTLRDRLKLFFKGYIKGAFIGIFYKSNTIEVIDPLSKIADNLMMDVEQLMSNQAYDSDKTYSNLFDQTVHSGLLTPPDSDTENDDYDNKNLPKS